MTKSKVRMEFRETRLAPGDTVMTFCIQKKVSVSKSISLAPKQDPDRRHFSAKKRSLNFFLVNFAKALVVISQKNKIYEFVCVLLKVFHVNFSPLYSEKRPGRI